MASRGDKINPLGMVARKHNEHRPFEARNKSRYGEAVTADSTVPDSIDNSDHTPLCILRTHWEAICLSRHMDTRTEDEYTYISVCTTHSTA